jgi:chromosome segregation ATPase
MALTQFLAYRHKKAQSEIGLKLLYPSQSSKMTDRLDRIEQNLSQLSDRMMAFQEMMTASASANQVQMETIIQAIANATLTVERMGERTAARLQQHDLELDDHDQRIERLERDHAEHAARMAKLEDIQNDMRQILQMMTGRLSGE